MILSISSSFRFSALVLEGTWYTYSSYMKKIWARLEVAKKNKQKKACYLRRRTWCSVDLDPQLRGVDLGSLADLCTRCPVAYVSRFLTTSILHLARSWIINPKSNPWYGIHAYRGGDNVQLSCRRAVVTRPGQCRQMKGKQTLASQMWSDGRDKQE